MLTFRKLGSQASRVLSWTIALVWVFVFALALVLMVLAKGEPSPYLESFYGVWLMPVGIPSVPLLLMWQPWKRSCEYSVYC